METIDCKCDEDKPISINEIATNAFFFFPKPRPPPPPDPFGWSPYYVDIKITKYLIQNKLQKINFEKCSVSYTRMLVGTMKDVTYERSKYNISDTKNKIIMSFPFHHIGNILLIHHDTECIQFHNN